MNEFLRNFLAKVEVDLTSEKLNLFKQSVFNAASATSTGLRDYYDYALKAMGNGILDFANAEGLTLKELRKIERKDLIAILEGCIERSLEIWVVAQPHHEQFSRHDYSGHSIEEIRSRGYFADHAKKML
jgi:hypothetical protein